MSFEDKTNVVKLPPFQTAPVEEDRAACFIVIAGSQAGRMYKLERVDLVLGRSDDVPVRVDDEGVSRRHARIVRNPDGTVSLVDLGSTNGTFCNGERVRRRILQDGDKIQVGSTTIIKFSYQDSIEEDFQRRQYESATRDSLTSCFNKKYFTDRLPSEYAFARRQNKPLSLAMIDVDHFKKLNDTFGHPAGDYVLQYVAKLAQSCVRMDDILTRYGGEEFALIMRGATPESAFIAAERVRRTVEAAHFSFEGESMHVTVSIGVATWNTGDDDPETTDEMVRLADEYLYRAKNNGRNRTESQVVR